MEFDDIVVKENPGLCRCCLSEGCYKDLGSEYAWMNDTEVYADMLLECFDISISQINEGPNGPNRLICEVCITRLRDACNFKKQVLECEKKFIDMVARGEFRKVIIYQEQMKAEEQDDDLPVDDYLEDPDFEDDEPLKREPQPTVSAEPLKVKSKRGRPKKYIEIKTDKKKTKTDEKKTKTVAKDRKTRIEEMTHSEKKDEIYRLLAAVISTSTIRPFRWFNNKYMCFFCCIPFLHSSKLKSHMVEEHSDVKVTNSLRRVLNAARLKLDISDLTCKLCSEEFDKFELYLEHATKIHKLRFNKEIGKCLFVFKLDDLMMSCYDCGEKFRFFGSLLRHAHKFHNKDSVFLCENCGEGFVNKSNLESHVRNVHLSEHKCLECDRVFKNHTALKTHIDKDHKNMYQCPKCPEVLGSRYLKSRHLALIHDEKVLQLKCEHCDQVFTTNRVLVQHTLRVHMKEKAFTCDLCGFKVFDKEGLSRHMVRHDDSRPFECDVCKKTFQRKKTLTLHKRIHTNDRRYACKVCGKAFVQATSLKLHMRVHHSNF